MNVSRRKLLLAAAGGVLVAADRPKRGVITLSTRPEDYEMGLDGFLEEITPIDRFFVRSHHYTPEVDLGQWKLGVEGEVENPLSLTMEELKKLARVELIAVCECAGNGRGFYEPSVPGLQWKHGGVGNGQWAGVRLADVLKKAGLKESAKEILFDGEDVPVGTMPEFQRTIPVKKAMDPNTLLAYEMNGETLPIRHGFPLRVVAPGWAGDSWVKWVKNIRVLDRDFDGFFMTTAYRHPGHPVAPGTAVDPKRMHPVTSLRVKSVIGAPADGSWAELGKPVTIRGAAWSGDLGRPTGVEVSVDGGRTWQAAKFVDRNPGPFSWRLFETSWTPRQAGYYNIMARAKDSTGDTQPLAQEWNPSGYGWNVVHRVSVDASPVRRESRPATAAAEGTHPNGYRAACLSCHEEDVIRQQRLSRDQWEREVDKMVRWGARVRPDDREGILTYLVNHFGPGNRR